MSSSQSSKSWQQEAFARLRGADDWVRAGDLFSAAEMRIPPHLATRFCARTGRPGPSSVDEARWSFFCHVLGSMGVIWERPGRGKHPGDRMRLGSAGICVRCGGDLRRLNWSAKKTLADCKECGHVDNLKGGAMAKQQGAAPTGQVVKPHPLVGCRVTQFNANGQTEMRNGTIVSIVPTGNVQFGDCALIVRRDGSRIDLVPLVEIGTHRNLWRIYRPDLAEIAEAAE